jgi:hypothetical protein
MITQIKGHGEKFTRRKEAAINGLLTMPTLDEAAKYAGVSSTTLWRWQRDPGFQAEIREARRHSMEPVVAQLQQASLTAVNTLQKIMQDPKASASARVTAAGKVLEMALKATQADNLHDAEKNNQEPVLIKLIYDNEPHSEPPLDPPA